MFDCTFDTEMFFSFNSETLTRIHNISSLMEIKTALIMHNYMVIISINQP